jgi:hypothetical protein
LLMAGWYAAGGVFVACVRVPPRRVETAEAGAAEKTGVIAPDPSSSQTNRP